MNQGRGPLKVMAVFGTRPEAVKMAPVVLELKQHEEIETIVTVTAQHRAMLDQVLNLFHIIPQYDLKIMQESQTLTDITTKAISGLDQIMKKETPDMVLVHGDTTTTFAASLAAFYNQIAVGHVEAGLRTSNKYSPFPEEMNRQLTGVMADLHFAPTKTAADNLLRENKEKSRIFITGNTAIDALKFTVGDHYFHPILNSLQEGQRLVLLTAHRRENLGERMKQMFKAVRQLVNEEENVVVVYPVHPNPRVQEMAKEELSEHPRIHLVPPFDLLDFHNLLARSTLVMTDSGGIQEEAPYFGVPVIVLRDTTERPEGIEAGTARLAGTDAQAIYEVTKNVLTDTDSYTKMAKAVNPYGDGQSSKRIVSHILDYFKNKG